MIKIGENQNAISSMVDCRDTLPCNDGVNKNMVDIVDGAAHTRDGGIVDSSKRAVIGFEGDTDFEPRNGIEFESHKAAYAFYQEYAKPMGFTTSIKNSRRSKKSKEFIDAKFACSRYGVTPESDVGSSRRSSVKKTDCKASMHVKRRPDGKWIIHEFVKEHNHELLLALAYHFRIYRNVKLAEKNNIDILNAVSERTRKIYVEMSRQSGGYQNVSFLQNDIKNQFDKGRRLVADEGEAQVMLEYFKRIKKENPDFFYAIDLNEEQRLRNLFWVDAKSWNDYVSFNDVFSFDTTYVKFNEKLSFAPFVEVNHHFQSMLLGCALLADETKPAFVWLMKTWLRAMVGQAPKVIITDQVKALKAAVEEVFPTVRHCFALWHILEKIPKSLAHVIGPHENFLPKYEEEAIADFDTWQKQPALKSPSPWEKQMSFVYRHAIFKKFQVEVLGVVGCHPKKEKENEDEGTITLRVQDFEKDENFMVIWNEEKSKLSCSCRLFEYREAMKSCVNVNSCISAVEPTGHAYDLHEAEEENQGSLASKSSKKKNTNKK
ncbi:hypothetical protein CRYUN_Cryun23aG0034300 [Craigia yunnanensis]